jgi:hypothetical protein
MADAISGDTIYPFKWFFRPEAGLAAIAVQLVDAGEEISFEQLPGVLAEIDGRHWSAIRQILIEAKLKAEVQLRNDEIIKSAQLTTYYQGWVGYADYVLANFEGLRAGDVDPSGQVRETMDVQR